MSGDRFYPLHPDTLIQHRQVIEEGRKRFLRSLRLSDFGLKSDPASLRVGGWITTFSGVRYWVSDPRAEDVRLEDIAHALSNICRYGGHVPVHYSVAQHCAEVAWAVYQTTGSKAKAFHGLIHDATEAYVGDMVSPLKISQPFYLKTEERNWCAIAEAFDTSADMPEEVHVADKRVCVTEFRDIRGLEATWMTATPYEWSIRPQTAEQAKFTYLALYDALWPYRTGR